MNTFAWALAGFVVLHIGVSATGLRTLLLARLGEGLYRALFSLLSLGLLAAIIYGFGQMRADPFDQLNAPLWRPAEWLRWPALALGFIATMFVVTGVLTPGPTYAGFEAKSLAQAEPARGVLRITRHPFLWGVAFWAAAHLLVNGERFALSLFGALGFMALYGSRSIDRKGQARDPEGWARFAAATSNVPFAAILQGRNRLALGEIGWRLAAGLAAFGLIVALHNPPVF
ncbi:nnrU family protein [alpha proteobacterium U9-1i]|nr:nnrU family protein [alpha proteobacterium U9-1i]